MHMSGPGEDDRALSQVTLQATSPRKTAGDVSVVDKVRDAVNSLLQVQESSQPTVFHSAKNSSSDITISTDAHEGDLIFFSLHSLAAQSIGIIGGYCNLLNKC